MKKAINTLPKNSEISNSLLIIKRNLYRSLLAILFLSLIYPYNISAQNCSYTLTAKNNIESVNKEGRVYFMELQNNSNEAIEINLSAANTLDGKNPDETDSKNNVTLNVKILSADGMEITDKISLKSNELLQFQIKVTVPLGTAYERWNSLLVNAAAEECFDYSSSLVLYTFIPDPTEN